MEKLAVSGIRFALLLDHDRHRFSLCMWARGEQPFRISAEVVMKFFRLLMCVGAVTCIVNAGRHPDRDIEWTIGGIVCLGAATDRRLSE